LVHPYCEKCEYSMHGNAKSGAIKIVRKRPKVVFAEHEAKKPPKLIQLAVFGRHGICLLRFSFELLYGKLNYFFIAPLMQDLFSV